MEIKIITAFPEFFSGVFCSILEKAIQKNLIKIEVIDIKKYAKGSKFPRIDDTPYGGGGGMILKPDVLSDCIEDNLDKEFFKNNSENKIIITSPRGIIYEQKNAEDFSKLKKIAIVTNRYEGVDQRVIDYYKMEEISIGNYITIGGEVASVVMIESFCRLIPNVIGNFECTKKQTFSTKNYKQHNLYTKPKIWNNIEVPQVLQKGNHKEIEDFRKNN